MSINKIMGTIERDKATAIPTKQFFVSMLTRDISLRDAILDLIDNCLDGALRLADGEEVDYAQHYVKIKLSSDQFIIMDNCGGISRDIAINYAFKMGRELDDKRDLETETIGMYGVGMKRAIFKMGRNALVRTRNKEETFEVPITSIWLDAKNWDPLPINDVYAIDDNLTVPGTVIQVCDLYPGVSRHFSNEGFLNEVRTAIAEHFTIFLQRGLKVEVNEEDVKPVFVEVLVSKREDGPAPFIFKKRIDGVLVSITVGLNSGRSIDEDEEDELLFDDKRSSATAGWTVLCNDRAVIVGDKSRLTGWGDGIPMYHDQFIVITGIVEFRSNNAEKLPITTTKRALDTSSNVWLESLVKMKEGIRIFISYTNQWKNHPRADQTKYWHDAIPHSLTSAIQVVGQRQSAKKNSEYIEYNPYKSKVLPEPEGKIPSSRRIVFSKPIEDIRLVSKMLFDSQNEKPGIVGDKCFDLILNKAKKKEVEE